MRLDRLIILILLSGLAGIPYVQADDLSDLVSFVVSKSVASDISNALPKETQKALIVSKPESSGFDSDILEGIATIMTEDSSYDFILNSVSDSSTSKDNKFSFHAKESWGQGPTLAKQGFFRPVSGIVTSTFGWRQQFNRMHKGVDLILHVGDTVKAAITGTVKEVAYDHDGYGNFVVITHPDGMETLYGHLQYALVSQGQYVEIGMPIGIGGNSGNSTGPHLHFEARINGVAVDPTMIFNFSKSYSTIGCQQNYSKTVKANDALTESPLINRRTYIVKQGDTLQSISKRSGISVMRLCQLNMLTENIPLEIGRMIKLK